jgi:hypothetical protein
MDLIIFKDVLQPYRLDITGYSNMWGGARRSVVVKALCYKPEVAGSIADEVNF